MADLSTLYPRLQTEALGAPPALMDLKIRDAARMFMREAPAWQVTHADITVVIQTDEYALTPPADAEVVRVLRVNYLGPTATKARPLKPVAESMLHPGWETVERGLEAFMSTKYNTLTLVPRPDVNTTGTLENVVMQLRPTRSAATIDDDVLNRWEEEIMVGAQWLLYDMQDQPWTNKAEARRYKLRFTKSWADARRELEKGFSQANLRVKIPAL